MFWTKSRECKNAGEFAEIFRAEVAGRGWDWKRDLRPWLADVLGGVKFGDPAFDWSRDAARALGREFLSDASTW